MLDLIERLVNTESPSHDKRAVDRCGDLLAGELRSLGADVRSISVSSAGNHLRAELGAGRRQLLLLGHLDTVWPEGQLARMPLRREGNLLYGPGVLDMKAGIGVAVLATRALLAVAAPTDTRITMLWTSDEEVGSRTSRALVEAEALRSEAVLVFEPALPGGGVKTSRKACGQYQLTVRGVAAHAGVDPGSGVSAIGELARQLLVLETLQDLERGISVNVGLIAGGSRPNVVAEEAIATIDVRAPTLADSDEINGAIRSLTTHVSGATLTVTGGFERPPMERSAATERLFVLACAAAADLEVSLTEGGTGGGSDGNFCAALGVATLDGLGAIGQGAHALHEQIEVDSLTARAALVAGLLTRLTESCS